MYNFLHGYPDSMTHLIADSLLVLLVIFSPTGQMRGATLVGFHLIVTFMFFSSNFLVARAVTHTRESKKAFAHVLATPYQTASTFSNHAFPPFHFYPRLARTFRKIPSLDWKTTAKARKLHLSETFPSPK